MRKGRSRAAQSAPGAGVRVRGRLEGGEEVLEGGALALRYVATRPRGGHSNQPLVLTVIRARAPNPYALIHSADASCKCPPQPRTSVGASGVPQQPRHSYVGRPQAHENQSTAGHAGQTRRANCRAVCPEAELRARPCRYRRPVPANLVPRELLLPGAPRRGPKSVNEKQKRRKKCENVEMSVGVYKGQETRGVSDGTPSGRAATRDRTAAVGEMKEGWVQRRMTR